MENPLHYFEELFSYDQSQEKKEKLIFHETEYWQTEVIKIDHVEGIITVRSVEQDESTGKLMDGTATISFFNSFESEINSKSKLLKKYILEKTLEISATGVSSETFLQQISSKFNLYKEKSDLFYSKYPFVKLKIEDLSHFVSEQLPKSTIQPFSNHVPITTSFPNATPVRVDNYSKYSFQWDAFTLEDSEIQLGQLYDLLTETPPLIEGDRQEFINAFTQREVHAGINWLVLAKNKTCAKSSLIYFLQQLEEKSGLMKEPDNFNKKVEYVFRDNLGQKLSNIKQSKSQVSDNPARKSRIDEIIEELEK